MTEHELTISIIAWVLGAIGGGVFWEPYVTSRTTKRLTKEFNERMGRAARYRK